MNNPFIHRQVVCKEGQKHLHKHPGNGNSLDSLSKVWGRWWGGRMSPFKYTTQWKWPICWRRNNSLQHPKLSFGEDLVKMSWEWGNSMPRIPQRCGKTVGRCSFQGQESSVVELGSSNQLQVIQMVGTSEVDLFASRQAHGVPQYFSLDISEREHPGKMP